MEPQTSNIFTNLLPFVVIFGIFYFLLIKPQQKQQKEWAKMLSGLKAGDEVVTTGGIIGKIVAVADGEVEIDIAPKTKVTILKTAVASLKTAVNDKTPAKSN